MITVISAFIGLVTGAFPDLLKFFRDKAEMQHEYLLMDKQIELTQAQAAIQLQQAQVEAAVTESLKNIDLDIAETNTLKETYKPIGIRWVDALSASVRPVITYSFFLLFAFVELCIVYQLITTNTPIYQAVQSIWGTEEKALFAAIIGYWFGHRGFRRAMGYIDSANTLPWRR